MKMTALSRNPILIQELETRARFPASYKGFLYEGPARAILMLGIPVLAGIAVWLLSGLHSASPVLLFLSTTLYTLYLAYSAARLAGGSLAVERQRQGASHLGSLPVSAWDIFIGKFVGSLAPLFVEIGLVFPVLLVLCLVGWGPLSAAVSLSLFFVATIVWYGLWGMFWSARSNQVDAAVNRSALTVTVMMYVMPLALTILASFQVLPTNLLHLMEEANPLVGLWTAISAFSEADWSSLDLISLLSILGVVGLSLFVSTLVRIRQTH
ncbi:MAG: hypothetical protein ACYCW6_28980 [Candidatus Xenobia bacterium]